MGVIKKVWKGEADLAVTNAYGGAVADLAADEAWDVTADVDLETDGYEGANFTLEYDGSDATDAIIVGVFSSLDGSDFDDLPIWEMECDINGGVDTQISFLVEDLSHFRIGVKTSGTSTTFDYRLKYDAWRHDG